MIVVIADDLTGAAELGGIGLRFDLNVQIVTHFNDFNKDVDLLIINTNSRSLSIENAEINMKNVCKALKEIKTELVFKKIDSVLRGYIIPEINIQMNIMGFENAFIIAPNPDLGRIIKDGKYFIGEQTINETSFANDPEFPAKYAEVLKVLKAGNSSIGVRKYDDDLSKEKIIVGEVSDTRELELWVQKSNKSTLLAGSSGFFLTTLGYYLQKKMLVKEHPDLITTKKLYICGSAFLKSTNLVNDLYHQGKPVSYMPDDLMFLKELDDNCLATWGEEIISHLKQKQTAIVAIRQEEKLTLNAAELRYRVAILVKYIFDHTEVDELLIEGGATAAAILKTLNLNSIFPFQEMATGVIRSYTNNNKLIVTLKPGSYTWPKEIWDF
jgi:uncharacterized protein YgbK (DUF1537 family)